MKKFLFIILSFILITGSCRKNRNTSPLEQLPPETQTGANTFGCLVNGEVFKPGGAQLSGGSLQCNYQFGNNSFHFVLIARNNTGNNLISSVGLFTDSLRIKEGEMLLLKKRIKGNPSGSYFKALSGYQYEEYDTDGSTYTGELNIKKLDPVNQIVSGTFWFDAVDANGKKVEIREGRFDVRYTQ